MMVIDGESPRTYRCTNRNCDQYGAELTIRGTPRGPFLEWPNLRCICGMEPMIVDPQIVVTVGPFALGSVSTTTLATSLPNE